ncbi:MAG: ribosomal protein S18-alanine N-acetyltransferase [Casimicrobiaceae bacterium]
MASLPKSPAPAPVLWRPLRHADVACVADLEAQIHAAPWTAGNFDDVLAAGYCSRVGERDGRIVAYGVLMLGPGEAQLLNLSVVAAARREGIGSELLRRFLDDASRLGAEQVFLEVRVGNAAAIAVYERMGFARVARRREYYPPGPADAAREDALVMRCFVGQR